MDENARTLYCGNLSEKITEDILYELFLQGGPIQKISIPKDRDGKQKTFAFITYKHIHSVEYALHLFDGTELYNRPLNMNLRNSESQQAEQSFNPVRNVNYMLELGQQMILGNYPPQSGDAMFLTQNVSTYPKQLDASFGNDDRIRRSHPYQRNRDKKQERDRNQERNRDRNREREREKDRARNRDGERNDHRDERLYHNRDNWNNHRSNGYSRYSDNRKRW